MIYSSLVNIFQVHSHPDIEGSVWQEAMPGYVLGRKAGKLERDRREVLGKSEEVIDATRIKP